MKIRGWMVKWNSQQNDYPDTDEDKETKVYYTPPGDELAIMLNALTVAVIGLVQFVVVIVEHVGTPGADVR